MRRSTATMEIAGVKWLASGLLAVAMLACGGVAEAQFGGKRGPGPGTPGPGGPGGPGRGVPGPAVPGQAGAPGFGVPAAAAAPRAAAVPPATAVPQPPPAARSLPPAAVMPPFTPAWYAQHPTAWQHPKPYADWRQTPAPPSAVMNAFFSPASASNPKLAAITATEWLPLGVFTPPPQAAMPPTSFQQLAVNKSGQVRGVMYDATTNAVSPINGVVDLATRRVTWSVGQPGGLGFESSLDRLLEPAPVVTVVTPSGSQPGTLVLATPP